MELWDIYDENKQPTGRTMRRNDWHMKPGEFHLTVLGVIARPDGTFLITKRVMTKAWAPGWWEVSGGAGKVWIRGLRKELRSMNKQEKLKKISIGVEDFKTIIEKDGYFVDKTLMIQNLIKSNAMVTLFTRPRRFGKTLNQFMIRRFFEDEITEKGA